MTEEEREDEIEQLVLRHRDYVRSLAHEILRKLPSHVELDDLLGFGEVGLVEAARKWRPGLGTAFTTFSYFRIRGAIFDGLRKLSGMPPRSRRKTREMQGQDEFIENGVAQPEATASAAQCAEEVGKAVVGLGAVFLLSQLGDPDAKLEDVAGEVEDTATRAEHNESVTRVREAVERLPEDQRQLLHWLYIDDLTMTECAERIGRHKSAVSRAHAKALDQLRTELAGGPAP
ncbi:MAG: sigma-70 family RNA polymerase sigma factor [Planctomycetota bacterium]